LKNSFDVVPFLLEAVDNFTVHCSALISWVFHAIILSY
jgi:hypothetical protein